MKLNSVIFADNSASCDIADLFVMLKNSTEQLLEQFASSHEIEDTSNTYLSDSITKQTLSEKMALVNNDHFMCFWFGHGKKDSFMMDGADIVTTTENYYVFTNAVIYTFSCFNGNDLADAVITNNGKVFVGYTGYAHCPYGIDDVTCSIAMSFVTSFLNGKSISNSVNDLRVAYEDAIFNDELEPFQRSRFQENRDGIVLKGDGTLTINDLLVA
jgi:hypothetical protein